MENHHSEASPEVVHCCDKLDRSVGRLADELRELRSWLYALFRHSGAHLAGGRIHLLTQLERTILEILRSMHRRLTLPELRKELAERGSRPSAVTVKRYLKHLTKLRLIDNDRRGTPPGYGAISGMSDTVPDTM